MKWCKINCDNIVPVDKAINLLGLFVEIVLKVISTIIQIVCIVIMSVLGLCGVITVLVCTFIFLNMIVVGICML